MASPKAQRTPRTKLRYKVGTLQACWFGALKSQALVMGAPIQSAGNEPRNIPELGLQPLDRDRSRKTELKTFSLKPQTAFCCCQARAGIYTFVSPEYPDRPLHATCSQPVGLCMQAKRLGLDGLLAQRINLRGGDEVPE